MKIDCIFTINYEIYGNGSGSLRELVFEPTARLIDIFANADVRFVCFVEAAEFEMIEKFGTDAAIKDVRRQIRQMHEQGFEIALHLHPQWYNGKWESGRWLLDDAEYNLCTLPRKRIHHIVERAIGYIRQAVGDATYTPLSFRAGNWLFQPSQEAAAVLVEQGVQIDSSVFKGGVQHKHRLDYRPSLRNGAFWRFKDDVNVPINEGPMLEIPIYGEMVPPWRMITGKRVGLQKKGAAAGPGADRGGRESRPVARRTSHAYIATWRR
jgi:peptidoglycan/xylan/chitin deacetylase (PgdA/CDA1 family)